MKKASIFVLACLVLVDCTSGKRGNFMGLTGKKVVMVISPGDFRDEELFHTKEVLEANNVTVKIASTSKGTFTGKLGAQATADLSLEEITLDYDAIVFVGGPGASTYFGNKKALSLAKEFYDAGKVTAAICIAPSILANAGLLEGKKATAFSSEERNLTEKKANYTGNQVEIDGLLVTANGPEAARAFGSEISRLLSNQ